MRSVADDPSFKWMIDREGVSPDDWVVILETETGLDKPTRSLTILKSREEAAKYISMHKVGSIVQHTAFSEFDILEYQKSSGGNWHLFSAPGDEAFPTCYEALVKAGVLDSAYNMRPEVGRTLTEERRQRFFEQFGDNWQTAFEFEYVTSKFPMYSVPYYAALVFFHYFISYDDYSFAYYWREMKLVLSKAENLALRSKKRYERAGEEGGRRSRQNRDRRIVLLLDHMQRLRDENPALARLGVRAIAELAIEDAARENPSLWRQGKGRVAEYLDEMRADHRYRDKYLTFLPKRA